MLTSMIAPRSAPEAGIAPRALSIGPRIPGLDPRKHFTAALCGLGRDFMRLCHAAPPEALTGERTWRQAMCGAVMVILDRGEQHSAAFDEVAFLLQVFGEWADHATALSFPS
jgi:hypothetical protein